MPLSYLENKNQNYHCSFILINKTKNITVVLLNKYKVLLAGAKTLDPKIIWKETTNFHSLSLLYCYHFKITKNVKSNKKW